MPDPLSQKSILVTGATSGIGYQSALDLASRGAFVIGAGRNPTRCASARERILMSNPSARVEYLVADLSSQRQVKGLADQVQNLLSMNGSSHLDVLVNNAGLYSSGRKFSEEGIELTCAVNYLAPFLLTHLLLPALAASPEGKVLVMSSGSHYQAVSSPLNMTDPRPYIGISAYATSNLARVLFAAEFNRRSPEHAVHAWVIDPGLVNTDIGIKDRGFISTLVCRSRQKQGTSPKLPSLTIQHLASTPAHEINNDLYWKDSQPKLPSHAALDPELARRLWENSCQWCQIKDYFGNLN